MYPSSSQALQDLTNFSNTRRSSQDIMTKAQNQYDIPGYTTRLSKLRGLVGNLESSVEAVDPSVTGRTSGTFTTEGQRQALVNKERTPILGDLSKQQNALGQEQQGYSLAATLADSLARSMMGDDQTKYQSLLDRYNATTAQEQAAEQRRQWEAQMAENKRQFDAQQAAARSSGAGGYGGGELAGLSSLLSGSKTGGSTDPLQQVAYNDVRSRVDSQSDKELLSDYMATASSAKYGNAKDLLKLQVYRQLRPDLFKAKYSWEK